MFFERQFSNDIIDLSIYLYQFYDIKSYQTY